MNDINVNVKKHKTESVGELCSSATELDDMREIEMVFTNRFSSL